MKHQKMCIRDSYDTDRVKFMVTQKVGDEFEEGMKILRELYTKAKTDVREDVPLSELRVGLKDVYKRQ